MTKTSSRSIELSAVLKQALSSMGDYGHTLLHNNEALTRYVLIDPVLRALGWNTADPKYVRVEYSMEEAGKPDYALLRAGKVVAIVEAKCWGTISRLTNKIQRQGSIDTQEIQKLSGYCRQCNANVGILTDGGAWWIFNFMKRKLSEPIMKIDFADAGEDDNVTDLTKRFSNLAKNRLLKLAVVN